METATTSTTSSSGSNNNYSSVGRGGIVQPVSGKKNVLITSALPYVNNIPHLGNLVGSVLSADVYARYLRGRNVNCIYICGTDEYGTATEAKAAQEGLSPKEICDKYHKIHREVYEWFQISFDKFGRTSTEQQTKIAQDIFLRLYEKGLLQEDVIEQLFCEKCDKFLADRFVEGTCNFCGYKEARGDQCDLCGKLINAIELINPTCKVDKTTPVIRKTKHLNLDLPNLSADLDNFVDNSVKTGLWSENAVHVTKGWLKEGLKQRCITRDLKWGIPVPVEGFRDKVLYVWFDAPIGYISITANYTDKWEEWWKNPKDVQLVRIAFALSSLNQVQFMGKDNIPFHTIIFPACLLGSGYNWTKLNSISTTDYLNYEGGKFSKSRNLGVFGTDAQNSGVPAEVWRYYLLSNRPEASDSSFSWDDLMGKINSELLANLGNFVNRALSFCKANFASKVPEAKLSSADGTFIDAVNKELKEYISSLDKIYLKDGLKIAMGISKLGNQYMQENKPWDLIKTDVGRCGTVIAVLLNLIKTLAVLLNPYIPGTSDKIYAQMKLQPSPIPDTFTLDIPVGHEIGEPAVLFKKLEQAQIDEFKAKFGGGEVKKEAFVADIRGGIIANVQDHPTDENLYVVVVDIGKEKRQAVARLKASYKKEDLVGKQVVLLCNLPLADFKGAKSEGMLLVSESKKGGNMVLLQPSSTAPISDWAGRQVIPEGTALEVSEKPILLKEFQKMDLRLSKDSKVIFKQKHLLKAGDVELHAPGVEGGAKIK